MTVVIDEPAGATLLRENVVGWGSLCQAPCIARLPRNGVYVVSIPGSKKTDELELQNSPAKVRLRFEKPSTGGMVAGSILAYAGGSLLPIGLVALVAGTAARNDGVTIAGVVISGVGGLGLGIGIPLMITNHYTHVEQEPVAHGLRAIGQF